jgi:hypothetical protein
VNIVICDLHTAHLVVALYLQWLLSYNLRKHKPIHNIILMKKILHQKAASAPTITSTRLHRTHVANLNIRHTQTHSPTMPLLVALNVQNMTAYMSLAPVFLPMSCAHMPHLRNVVSIVFNDVNQCSRQQRPDDANNTPRSQQTLPSTSSTFDKTCNICGRVSNTHTHTELEQA